MTKDEQMKSLLRQSHAGQSNFLSMLSAFGMGTGLFLAPGLLIGVLITQERVLLWLFLFFASALGAGAFLQWLLGKSDHKRFIKMATAEGASEHEAKAFLKDVNWDEVFPEYD